MNGTDYRLTESDEERARAAIVQTLAKWAGHRTDRETLRRIAAHSIGCPLDDLRDVEVQWIDNEIGEHEMGMR